MKFGVNWNNLYSVTGKVSIVVKQMLCKANLILDWGGNSCKINISAVLMNLSFRNVKNFVKLGIYTVQIMYKI